MNDHRAVELYHRGPASDARAPILVTHFDGAMDAGAAGNLAVSQLLRSLGVERVATFDSDLLVDYRSHRPVMSVEGWVTSDLEMPEIALDLIHDDLGHPVLLLHGPEPDARWEAFADAVGAMVRNAGVEISFSLYGIPAGVPHTRPTPVHVQASDASLVPDQPQMAGTMQFPAPMAAFLQTRLAQQGIEGASLIAAVPYYMAENAYPRGASALLSRLAEFADLSLPVGDLERGAQEDLRQVKTLIEGNAEVSQTVRALEHHYDSMVEDDDAEAASAAPVEDTPDDDTPEDIGDVIEAYLANRDRRERESDGDHLTGVRKEKDRARPRARHRAENPWDRSESDGEDRSLGDGRPDDHPSGADAD